jgi:hypothetical protein
VDELISIKLANSKFCGNREIDGEKVNREVDIIMNYLENPYASNRKVDCREELEVAKRKINLIEKLMAESIIES